MNYIAAFIVPKKMSPHVSIEFRTNDHFDCTVKINVDVIERRHIAKFINCLESGGNYDINETQDESEGSTQIGCCASYVTIHQANAHGNTTITVPKNESLVRAFTDWEHWLSMQDDLWKNWTVYTRGKDILHPIV